MIKLGVNIDHIATIRQARREEFPSIVEAAAVCEKGGADGITIHLREDRRHIQDRDVYALKDSIRTKLNLEMAASEEIMKIALEVKPDYVCLVPEKREELTTEGGLDVAGQKEKLTNIVANLKQSGIVVSMFIDADIMQVEACKNVGADCIEIHTGKYAQFYGKNTANFEAEVLRIEMASKKAVECGLILNAGHGLDYNNLERICKIKFMNEFNIGFSIVAESVFSGLENAVKKMKNLIKVYTPE